MEYLYDKLMNYNQGEIYPMHMPGHKRNTELMNMMNPYGIDITEIDGFDNLHDAQDILLENMNDAAKLYGSLHTHYLINGSTSGLLVAVAACTNKGDRILMARNCHKAVYNAVYLNELNPVYLYPSIINEYGISAGITAKQVKEKLNQFPDIKAIVITSPTYEGITSEVKEIVELSHSYKIPVIVDEAHGAHFGFSGTFPPSSVSLGADIVIHSVHKTLPAFTQTALIHINGPYVDYDAIQRYLGIYQTSSPSYVLMAGISNCIRLLKEKKELLFAQYEKKLDEFYDAVRKLSNLTVLSAEFLEQTTLFKHDRSKIVIFTTGCSITGVDLYHLLLDKYKIQCEMVEKNYVLAMTSIADTKEGFDRLRDALIEIDQEITSSRVEGDAEYFKTHKGNQLLSEFKQHQSLALTPYEAYNQRKESIGINQSVGKIAGAYVYLYPPGIPLLVPGEYIANRVITIIDEYNKMGLKVKGLVDEDKILILAVGDR